MFADPFTAIMALVVLNFAGMLVLFLFILRSLDAVQRAVHEARGSLQLRIADTEHQLNDLAAAIRELSGSKENSSAIPAETQADLGAMLEQGVPKLRRQDGFDLPELKLADVAGKPSSTAQKTPAPAKNGGSGPLDIL